MANFMYRTPLSSVNMSFNLLHIKPRQASCQGGIIKIKCAPDICLAGKLCMRQIITESAPATHDHTRFLQDPCANGFRPFLAVARHGKGKSTNNTN
jgi:hypothetical protein